MTEKYLTINESVEKYKLNVSKFTFAIRNANANGLYKAVFRKRTRIYLHQEYLEKWMRENDIVSPCKPTNCGRPKKAPKLTVRNERKSKNKGYW
jgi:hypothetical protein